MNLQVLLSCMNQKDTNIVKESNLNDIRTLIVNQCDCEKIITDNSNLITMINTNTRGLSVSRNIAIENADSDICVLSDDDEFFLDHFDKKIISAYQDNPDADIIIFSVSNFHQKLGNKKKWLKKYDLLRVSSVQITFRTSSIQGIIKFDEKLGAGTDNGGGEENKFLFDCKKNKKKILYIPQDIAVMKENMESTWFFGYTEEFFRKQGTVNRYLLGPFVGLLYCFYTIIVGYEEYKNSVTGKRALGCIMRGFFFGRIK